jgi:hypothetical protein
MMIMPLTCASVAERMFDPITTGRGVDRTRRAVSQVERLAWQHGL